MNKTALIFAFCAIVLLLCGCKSDVSTNNAPLIISISFPKTEYSLGETVEGIIEFENVGEIDLLVRTMVPFTRIIKPEGFSAILISIWDPKNEMITFNKFISHDTTVDDSDFVLLSPNSTALKKFNLHESTEYRLYGKYTVVVSYQNYKDPRDAYGSTDTRQAWHGKIESPPAYFEILP